MSSEGPPPPPPPVSVPPPVPAALLAAPKKSMPVWGIVLVVIAVAIGAWAGQAITRHVYASWQSHRFDQKLVEACADLNRKCPMMVDRETRLDSTSIGPARTWHYHYTLVHFKKEQLNLAKLEGVMQPPILKAYRTSPDLVDFRSYGVTLVYEYSDVDGVYLFAITVGPGDLK